MRVGATILSLLFVLSPLVLRGGIGAQVRPDSVRVTVPIPDRLRDSLRADSIRRAPATGARAGQPVVIPDSIAERARRARQDSSAAARAGDTVKAPIARFETPKLFEFTDRMVFSRDEILSSNSVNLADILDRVPGVTSFRSGWIGGVHVASYHSDFKRIRYFLDGVELDALQEREGGVMELTDLPLWTLDELVIERAAGEVRVWMRSWSTNKTTPYTRADIFTGDLNTNGFRALFARRYRNGLALQFGGQQAATQTGRISALSTAGQARGAGDGSQQMVNLRAGWSRGLLTVDMLGNVSARDRDPQTAREGFRDLAAFKGSRREAYFRVGYGDTTRGVWSHALVNLLRTRLEGIRATSTTTTGADTASADTIAGRTQQMLAVGYRASAWQVSALDRIRPIRGTAFHAPALRASGALGFADAGVYAEQNGADSTRRMDFFGRVQPLPWLAVTGAYSNRTPIDDSTRVAEKSMRVEGAVRAGRTWISAGIVRADPTSFANPVILGVVPVLLPATSANGITGTVRGNVYKDVRLDAGFERWDTPQFGRARMHAFSEVALISNWLRKFPKGEFGIDARMNFEFRGSVPFLFGVDTLDAELPDVRSTDRVLLVTGKLQIRIQRASLFYIYRNLSGSAYEQVPGLTLPPAVQMYGVRWEFFN
jgi:hypothetical protein